VLKGNKCKWYTGPGLPTCCPLKHDVRLHDQVLMYLMHLWYTVWYKGLISMLDIFKYVTSYTVSAFLYWVGKCGLFHIKHRHCSDFVTTLPRLYLSIHPFYFLPSFLPSCFVSVYLSSHSTLLIYLSNQTPTYTWIHISIDTHKHPTLSSAPNT